jgi:hypothetical protein
VVARGFRRTRHGLRAKLDDQERSVLAHLFVDVYELLDDGVQADPDPLAAMIGIGTSVDLPDDPALARLLPDAHADDPVASSEFRRYTEQGLRERKRQCLETARLTLGRPGSLSLDDAEAQAWLVALTDVRLVLAERMGLRTEEDHEVLLRRLGVPLDEIDVDDVGDVGDLDGLDEALAGDAVADEGPDRAGAGAAGPGALLGEAVDEAVGAVEPAQAASVDEPASDDELDDGDRAQLAAMLSLYDFLTWLQETLVQAVSDD